MEWNVPLSFFSGLFILTTTDLLTEEIIIYGDVPSAKTVPLNLKNKNVIIIDVAYKKEILNQIISLAKKVTFIDHHVSIRDDVLSMKFPKPHEIIYDEKQSGSSLTWNYFYGERTNYKITDNIRKLIGDEAKNMTDLKNYIPKFVEYIEDNDIGAWKKKHTIPFINALQVKYKLQPTTNNFKHWENLFKKEEIIKLIKYGVIYDEYKNYLIEENLRKYSLEQFPSKLLSDKFPSVFKKPGQYRVVLYNGSGCPSASHLSIAFLKTVNCDFVIFWSLNLDKKEYILQFRSSRVDVSQIAKLFGGGGHTLASACAISIRDYNIVDLFMPNSLPRISDIKNSSVKLI